jgi:hypothetical protein
MRAFLLALFALLICAAPAAAHTRSETHSSWRIEGPLAHLTFTIPELEAKRLSPSGHDVPAEQDLANYVGKHVGVTGGGQACPMIAPPKPVAGASGMLRFEMTFKCADEKDMAVSSTAFFEIVPTHTNFAQIQVGDRFIEQLITKDAPTLDIAGGEEGELKNAGFFKYVSMGVMHIFTGIDHQLFLIGLLLLSRKLKDLVFVITGFTIGHSLTLALAVTGLLRPHPEYIDALVGLTIALVGAEALAEHTDRPFLVAAGVGGLMLAMAFGKIIGLGGMPVLLLIGGGIFSANYLTLAGHLRDAARLRMVVTVVFGLIHGFGFAANLLEMRLPKERLAELLVGFNLGVEVGQLTLVLTVSGIVALLVKWKLALPRNLVNDFGSAFLMAMGMFWFFSRAYI